MRLAKSPEVFNIACGGLGLSLMKTGPFSLRIYVTELHEGGLKFWKAELMVFETATGFTPVWHWHGLSRVLPDKVRDQILEFFDRSSNSDGN